MGFDCPEDACRLSGDKSVKKYFHHHFIPPLQGLSARNSIQASQLSCEPREGIRVAEEDTPDGERVFYNSGSSCRSRKKGECNFESRFLNSIHNFIIKVGRLPIWVCKTEYRFTNLCLDTLLGF